LVRVYSAVGMTVPPGSSASSASADKYLLARLRGMAGVEVCYEIAVDVLWGLPATILRPITFPVN
jgi:hypothetical protein